MDPVVIRRALSTAEQEQTGGHRSPTPAARMATVIMGANDEMMHDCSSPFAAIHAGITTVPITRHYNVAHRWWAKR